MLFLKHFLWSKLLLNFLCYSNSLEYRYFFFRFFLTKNLKTATEAKIAKPTNVRFEFIVFALGNEFPLVSSASLEGWLVSAEEEFVDGGVDPSCTFGFFGWELSPGAGFSDVDPSGLLPSLSFGSGVAVCVFNFYLFVCLCF